MPADLAATRLLVFVISLDCECSDHPAFIHDNTLLCQAGGLFGRGL